MFKKRATVVQLRTRFAYHTHVVRCDAAKLLHMLTQKSDAAKENLT